MSEEYELTITKVVPAARKAVFQAWLDAKALAKFMTPGEGMTVPKAEADPRVGGQFLIVMKAGDKELPHSGEYKEIKEYDRISFSWVSPFSGPSSLVTLSFKELNANETEVTLHHAGLGTEESRDNHKGGWTMILEALGTQLA